MRKSAQVFFKKPLGNLPIQGVVQQNIEDDGAVDRRSPKPVGARQKDKETVGAEWKRDLSDVQPSLEPAA